MREHTRRRRSEHARLWVDSIVVLGSVLAVAFVLWLFVTR